MSEAKREGRTTEGATAAVQGCRRYTNLASALNAIGEAVKFNARDDLVADSWFLSEGS